MGSQGRNSEATDRALALVESGSSVHGAALKEGISPSTLFRARKRLAAAIGSKGGKAKGKRKARSPEHYKRLADMKRKVKP
jgi:transposase-like protein